jgi:regulator of cell morphogenesis and NO signaling
LCAQKIVEAKEKEVGSRILADILTNLGKLTQQHLIWEEHVFFPYLRSKLEHQEPRTSLNLQEALKKIKSEHASISRLLKKTRLISNGYTPSLDSSPSLRLCYAQLFDFEQDLLKHFFLEDNILFPKLFNQ